MNDEIRKVRDINMTNVKSKNTKREEVHVVLDAGLSAEIRGPEVAEILRGHLDGFHSVRVRPKKKGRKKVWSMMRLDEVLWLLSFSAYLLEVIFTWRPPKSEYGAHFKDALIWTRKPLRCPL